MVHDGIAARVAPLPLVLATLALAAPSPPSASAARERCPALAHVRCFVVTVPLDRAGALPGTVRLRAMRVPSRRASRPPLVGLTGGPGQAAVAFAETYDALLPTAGRDLVMFDQRGTGGSGLLRCRAFERSLGTTLDVPAGACGRALGPRRAYYTSADSADDLEALRAAIGADRIALYTVSYGSRVALDYARRHPDRVERMILDSPVGLDGPDSLARDTLGAIPRVLHAACRRGCGGAAEHPVADVARLATRLRRAPIRRRVGRRRASVRIDADDLLSLIVGGDLDTDLLRAVPPAVRDALRGRTAALARLKLAALDADEAGPISEFSPALFAATTCEESALAWDRAADPATRRAQALAALAAAPGSAQFDRAAALTAGLFTLCEDWPAPVRPPPPPAPAPVAIPTLVLAGDLDLRTPLESSRALAAQLPGATIVVERDVGHGVVGSDPDGCADPAVRLFLAARPLPRCGR